MYDPAPDSHAGRVIVVTGAGDGIGQAVALALARQGATVGLLGRTQRKLERTYDRIVKDGGPKPALLPFNLETAAAPEYDALHAALEGEFGRVDGLAHVAGILGMLSPIDHYDVRPGAGAACQTDGAVHPDADPAAASPIRGRLRLLRQARLRGDALPGPMPFQSSALGA
jgi:NAD(P)-dependent dehydrogenase (short-subunit alcohol dehydrogenase family)